VLHDVDLLGAQVGDQAHAEGVGTGDASLVVEELEPLLGQEAQTDLAGMLGALAALDGSAGSGGSGGRPGGGHRQGALGCKCTSPPLVLPLICENYAFFDVYTANG